LLSSLCFIFNPDLGIPPRPSAVTRRIVIDQAKQASQANNHQKHTVKHHSVTSELQPQRFSLNLLESQSINSVDLEDQYRNPAPKASGLQLAS
jgi:hypothetical protein